MSLEKKEENSNMPPLSLYCIPQGCAGVLVNIQGALMTHGITTCVGVQITDRTGRVSLSHADAGNYSDNFFEDALVGFSNHDNVIIRLYGNKGNPVFESFIELAQKQGKELKVHPLVDGQDAVLVERKRQNDGSFAVTQSKFLGERFFKSQKKDTYSIEYGPEKTGLIEEYERVFHVRSINIGLCPKNLVHTMIPLYNILTNGIWNKAITLTEHANNTLTKNWKKLDKDPLAEIIASKVIDLLGKTKQAEQVTENIWNSALLLRNLDDIIAGKLSSKLRA